MESFMNKLDQETNQSNILSGKLMASERVQTVLHAPANCDKFNDTQKIFGQVNRQRTQVRDVSQSTEHFSQTDPKSLRSYFGKDKVNKVNPSQAFLQKYKRRIENESEEAVRPQGRVLPVKSQRYGGK